jgi:serine protease
MRPEAVLVKPGPEELGSYRPRVVVKFREHVRLPYEDGVERQVDRLGIGPWADLARAFPGITLLRLFREPGPEGLPELQARAVELDPTYRPPPLERYFAIEVPTGTDPEALAKAIGAWRTVETAYVEGGPTPPPVVNALDDPRSANQGYLDAAPDGIDAEYAWPQAGGLGFAGGDGTGIRFVDLEQGWTLNHEDLAAAGITLISGVSQAYFGHGTSVLGEIAAVDNTLGCVGIAPAVGARVVSQYRTATTYSTADAILSAIANMSFGDVLLLEAQTSYPGVTGYLPVEVEDAVYDAIRLGTALGIVIVEAGGNGSNDLDTFVTSGGAQVLNRASAGFRDSGAIMVGAASSTSPHTPMWFTNFGSRIDCFGWGENIDTTGDGFTGNLTTSYTSTFGGTSGASPIVSGAALVLQGIAQDQLGYRFSPGQIRAMLADPATGTLSQAPATDRIGVMPNLRAIIDNVLQVAPDVYLRDFLGDTGDPHTGAISASPDIILRPTAVPNPQAAFGEGSGTENSNTLGYEAEAGQDNFIYVRVRNRGGSSAANVQAQIFWAPVATLLTPDLWTAVGATALPNVPAGDILTVSSAITWPAASIPGTGHYCFVGLVGNAQDPAPAPADFMNWDNFRQFIRNQNNVTWRNFNVVNNVPPGQTEPPGYVPLPFLVTGAPDRARRMGFEVIGRLPEGARLLLELPTQLLEMFHRQPHARLTNGRGGMATLPVNPHGRLWLGIAPIPAKARMRARLLVQIPDRFRNHEYEVHVRQLYGEEEVGRVTWRLTPERAAPKREGKKMKRS